MIEIIPGINEKTFDEIQRQFNSVKNLVDWVQIDVLDNTLIYNDTYNNFEAFRIFNGTVKLEAHLMVAQPENYVQRLVDNGFTRLIAHVEVESIRDFLDKGRSYQIELGVALDAPSALELVEPYLGEVDTVLLMMYKAGMSGQAFQVEQLVKIKKIHEDFPKLPIEVDGGINKTTAPLVKENGASRLVSTSFLFWKNPDRLAEAIEELKTA